MIVGIVGRDGDGGLKVYLHKTQAKVMNQPMPKEGEKVIILTANEATARISFLLNGA